MYHYTWNAVCLNVRLIGLDIDKVSQVVLHAHMYDFLHKKRQSNH